MKNPIFNHKIKKYKSIKNNNLKQSVNYWECIYYKYILDFSFRIQYLYIERKGTHIFTHIRTHAK